MTGKDLGPMLLGYTLPSGAPHRVGVSDAGVPKGLGAKLRRWLTARMGGLTPEAAHFNQGTLVFKSVATQAKRR